VPTKILGLGTELRDKKDIFKTDLDLGKKSI